MHHGDADGVAMSDGAAASAIRTPDQRLRVFVSSTLKELEPERRTARTAIERLRLAPVMFELGARPHPPQQLYRAYLEQSDVFIGIYWQQYGWIAPGEEISGLEDEYRLAPRDMPKLIYLKQPAERDPRLGELLARIRDDDTASYTPFTTTRQLGRLIEADLATLLAERFDASRAASRTPAASAVGTAAATEQATNLATDHATDQPGDHLPVPYTTSIGREREVATLLDWLGDDSQRVTTLVGPGGIGKSRLSIEVARSARERFDRVTFVALEHVNDPSDVVPAIARELGVQDAGDRPLAVQLGVARAGRRDLIVLDSFEQVLPAAADVMALLDELPDATFLVTSRARLRIRGERVFDVEPLGLPPDPAQAQTAAELENAPAMRLFIDRARAANPHFEVTAENAEGIARICRALEGVPLAIELAAARIRVLTPATMLGRLDRVLPLLVTAARDIPERQQTIQATVEWSVGLLSPEARALFVRLGVFAGAFSLEAVESITTRAPWATDLLGLILELVDSSLLRQHETDGVPLFSMLVPVREIASDRFDREPDAAAVRRAHGEHYLRLAAELEPLLQGATQSIALGRLEAERDNLRAAYRHLIAIGSVDSVARAVWRLFLYWWIRGQLPEAKAWMEEILASGERLREHTRAIALGLTSWVSLWQPGTEIAVGRIEWSVSLFHAVGDRVGEAGALTTLSIACAATTPPDLVRAEGLQRRALELVTAQEHPTYEALFRNALGSLLVTKGDPDAAIAIFDRVLDDARRFGDLLVESVTLANSGWAWLARGEPRPELFARHLELSIQLGSENGTGHALEGLAACATAAGDIERGGLLLGASETARLRTGLINQRSNRIFRSFVEEVLASDHAAEFEAARERGRRMPRRAALDLVLDPAPIST
ncbi:MAG: ATPase-like protein [Agromyces sp.]|nr:ATPase-like protein [Agromyces sp.]